MAFHRLSQKVLNLRNSFTNNNSTYLELDESRTKQAIYSQNNINKNTSYSLNNNVFVNPIGPLFDNSDSFVKNSEQFCDQKISTTAADFHRNARQEISNNPFLQEVKHERSKTSTSLGSSSACNNRISPINISDNNGRRLASSDQTDSGFTSPARSLTSSGGKGSLKFDSSRANKVDLLKNNFQQIKKHAVSFKSWQCPKKYRGLQRLFSRILSWQRRLHKYFQNW